MLHLIKDEICNVTGGGRNVAVAAVNTPAQKQKLRISQDQKESASGQSEQWVFIHSFIHDGQKSMSDIPLHAARGKKVGKLSGNEGTMEVKQVT